MPKTLDHAPKDAFRMMMDAQREIQLNEKLEREKKEEKKYISERIAQAPFHSLMTIMFNPSIRGETVASLEEIGISMEQYRQRAFDNEFLETELKSRLMRMDPKSELFNMAVFSLMHRAKMARHAYEPYVPQYSAEKSLVLLFHISNRLTPPFLQRIGYILKKRTARLEWMYEHLYDEATPDFEFESFAVHVEMYKKHPQTLNAEEQFKFIELAAEVWLQCYQAVPYATDMLQCMMKSRHALTEKSRACLYDALSESYVNEVEHFTLECAEQDGDDPDDVAADIKTFKDQVKLFRRKLSIPSMTWLRIQSRVRMIGRLSLMIKESAEKLYAPGGDGYVHAMKRLRAGREGYVAMI